jgi:hypothetical protein
LFRDEAEKDFLECSELAQAEIKAFHQRRITEFRLALLYYTEVLTRQGVSVERLYCKRPIQCLGRLPKY